MIDTMAQLIDSNRQLQKVNQELGLFFELSIDLLAITDEHGVFTRLSKSWEDATGYTCEELMSKPFVYFVVEEDVAKTVKEDNSIQAGNTTIDFVNRYTRKDGGTVTLEWRSRSINGVSYAIARVIAYS